MYYNLLNSILQVQYWPKNLSNKGKLCKLSKERTARIISKHIDCNTIQTSNLIADRFKKAAFGILTNYSVIYMSLSNYSQGNNIKI